MVLGDDSASPTAADFASDSSPSSDDDTYSETSRRSGHQINESEIRHPIPLVGPLFGYTNADLVRFINRRIEYETKILRRPMTQDEATAVAFWTSRAYSMTSYGAPTGVGIGLYRAYKTAHAYRFPFVTRIPESFNPNKLFFLEGYNARVGWHGLRGISYALIGGWFGRFLAFSYAFASRMAGEKGDRRLSEMNKAEAEYARDVLNRNRAPLDRGFSSGRGSDSRQNQHDDDRPQREDDGFYSDSRMQENEVSQQAPAGRSPAENRASTFEMNKVESQPSGFGDDHDDASPTAPAYGSSSSAGSSGESAWSRVRRHSGSPSDQGSNGAFPRSYDRPPARQQPSSNQGSWARTRASAQNDDQQAPPGGDGFSFSKSDEDRQLAREEAQKEFDARIERERQGQDFSGEERRR